MVIIVGRNAYHVICWHSSNVFCICTLHETTTWLFTNRNKFMCRCSFVRTVRLLPLNHVTDIFLEALLSFQVTSVIVLVVDTEQFMYVSCLCIDVVGCSFLIYWIFYDLVVNSKDSLVTLSLDGFLSCFGGEWCDFSLFCCVKNSCEKF